MARLAHEDASVSPDPSIDRHALSDVSKTPGVRASHSPARALLEHVAAQHMVSADHPAEIWSLGRAFRLIIMSCLLFWSSVYLIGAAVF